MEITDPFSIYDQLTIGQPTNNPTEANLNILLAANAEIAKRKRLYPTRQIRLEASAMRHPLDFKQTFAYLGLMLGIFPPASFFLLFLLSKGLSGNDAWVVVLLTWVNIATAVAGYFSGKVAGSVLDKLSDRSLSFLILTLPFIGFAWGAVSGAAGGVFIFVIGAIFGAFIGGIVGALALPAFALVHRSLTIAGLIDLKHFLPIAAGITFSICAFILGSAGR